LNDIPGGTNNPPPFPLKTLGMNLIRQLGSKDFPGYNNCPVAIYAYAVYGG
jgi:hypothetical protein